MRKKDNKKIASLLGAALIFVLTINAAYAYFTSQIEIDNGTIINVNAPVMPTFMAYASDKLELNVTSSDLLEANALPVVSDNASIIASLSSANGDTIHCKYDIIIAWDTTNQYTVPTTTLSGEYKYEISLQGKQTISNDTTGHTYSVTQLNETNLTALTWVGNAGTIGRKATLIQGAEIYSNSTTATQAKWDFTINFYSLPTDQSALLGKNYSAHITVTNVTC